MGLTPGLLSSVSPGAFNAVQSYGTTASQKAGIVSTYPLTPPRTFGVEFQYRF
jgi:hypothetical protein